ncbi:hypothetical protein ABG067_004156 [Albugo candida]|uniref:Uncharacterized protein n=1 Tax=Albugo candida TaxID=65357 RepID=A0A024GGD8_9STRA|nr:unnamed protein product [Albugo candida]|eukprot:CCI45917.1 unnamed protein product [Albugo candida]
MGSYLTLINNTEVTYECKVGIHESALKKALLGATFAGAGIATLSLPAIFVSAFAATFLFSSSGLAGMVTRMLFWATIAGSGLVGLQLTGVFGPNHQLKSMRMTLQQFDYFNESIVSVLNDDLERKKFFAIKSGESHQYEKMTLGLVRQATCVRNVYISNVSIGMQVLLVKPMWTSVIPNENRNYDLKAAMVKNGISYYMVNSAKFMEYENKTFSAQSILSLNASQLMRINDANTPSPGSTSTPTANPPALNNLQPIIPLPVSNQEHNNSVLSGSIPNLDSTKPQYAPIALAMAPTANTSGNNGHAISSRSRSIQPPAQNIYSLLS